MKSPPTIIPSDYINHHTPFSINGASSSEYFTVETSETDNIDYLSLVRIDLENNTRHWRVNEDFEVTDVGSGYAAMQCYNSDTDRVFFTSVEDPENLGSELPRIRHLWSVLGRGNDKSRTCLTCDLDRMGETADRCRYIDPQFSGDCGSVMIQCLGTGNTAPMTVAATVSGK